MKKLTRGPRYCRTCENYKPPRAHHCRQCKKYVVHLCVHRYVTDAYDRCVLRMGTYACMCVAAISDRVVKTTIAHGSIIASATSTTATSFAFYSTWTSPARTTSL